MIATFYGNAALFLQRLAVSRSYEDCIGFDETAKILLSEKAVGEDLAQRANAAVRNAIYRHLSDEVDRRDLIASVRTMGYRLNGAVKITGEITAAWESWTTITKLQGTSNSAGTSSTLDRQVVELLRTGHRPEDIKVDLKLSDAAFAEILDRLPQFKSGLPDGPADGD